MSGVMLSSTSFAQTQQDWQIMERRLEILENEIAVLRATAAINADQASEITGTDALLRLARLEEFVRENSGALETLAFRLQQLQQNNTAYQNDVELRFQNLQEELLRLARLEEFVRENSGALEMLAVRLQQLQQNNTAYQNDVELRFQNLQEEFSTILVDSQSADSRKTPDLSPELADDVSSGTDVSATAAVDVLSEEATDDATEETNISLLENNPFPDFRISQEAVSEVSPESVSEAASSLDLSEELAVVSKVETNPELEPKILGVLTVENFPERQENTAIDSQNVDPASIYENNFALVESEGFLSNSGLQDEAIQGFKNFVATYPEHEKVSEAHYSIGEIFYLRNDYVSAAEAFLKAVKANPGLPRNLLKLGVTLRHLEQTEQACNAFDELLFSGRFTNLTDSTRRVVDWERQRANC